MQIQVDGLAGAVRDILDQYTKGIQDGINDTVMAAGKTALSTVKAHAPVRKGRGGGKYKKGWKIKKERTGIGGRNVSITVYNATSGSLTHLLEHGHQKANGGRVEGTPHISTAVEAAERELDQSLSQALEEAGDDL